MRILIRALLLVLVAVSLVSCGSGGGGFVHQAPTISISASRTVLPLNVEQAYPTKDNPGAGSLYRAHVTVVARSAAGVPLSGDKMVQWKTENPDLAVLYPEDMKAQDADGNPQSFWSYAESAAGGISHILVQGGPKAGTAYISASVNDGLGTAEARIAINIGQTSTGEPSVVQIEDTVFQLYVSGLAGAASTATVTAYVMDSAEQPVPAVGHNNLRLEIIASPNSGEELEGVNVQGSVVRGKTIDIGTATGIVQFTLRAGTQSGNITVRGTTDRDNNVDDGLTNPSSASRDFYVADGRLASLSFAGDYVNAVTGGLTTFNGHDLNNGVYYRVVSVLAKGADGHPVPAGTPIQFSVIDSPIAGYPQGPGTFVMSGTDGNPEESGLRFSAASGHFRTNKAIPLVDRLVVNGQGDSNPSLENDFLTGIRTIASVPSETQLTVTTPFRSGQADTGATVPYVIGRASYASILSPAWTDSTGKATTILAYPVNRINQTAVLVASGNNGVSTVLQTGGATFLADAGPAGDGLIMTTSVTKLTPNTEQPVTLCVRDASNHPVPAHTIDWYVDTGAGTGAIPTVIVNGGAPIVTDDTGCATFTVVTTAAAGSDKYEIVFGNPALFAEPVRIEIMEMEVVVLASATGSPTSCANGNSSTYTISVQVVDKFGTPIVHSLVTFETKDGTMITPPTTSFTDEEGKLPDFTATVSGPTTPPPGTSTATAGGVTVKSGGASTDLALASCM